MKPVPHPDLCIFIPCHNEAQNLPELVKEITEQELPPYKVLIINDNSTDETGLIAENLTKKYSTIEVIHRKPPNGRGYAGRTGWLECLKFNPKLIMEMDADQSHNPKHLPEFIKAQKQHNADAVLGSRYMRGGREVRGILRKLLSWGAEKYLKTLLGTPYLTDPSSGFRLFTRKTVEAFNPATLTMPDHRVTPEILFRIRNMKIIEIPIEFHDRKYGKTKLKWSVVIKSLISPLIWRLQSI